METVTDLRMGKRCTFEDLAKTNRFRTSSRLTHLTLSHWGEVMLSKTTHPTPRPYTGRIGGALHLEVLSRTPNSYIEKSPG